MDGGDVAGVVSPCMVQNSSVPVYDYSCASDESSVGPGEPYLIV